MKRFEMYGNPIEHTHDIAGVSRTAENIVAIRDLDELNVLLNTLTGYWRAFAAVGCLCGLRLAELVWLKRSDVYLQRRYLRVTSRKDASGDLIDTKTGRERSVPIEKTKAFEILTDYAGTGAAGSWRDHWPWFFPTLLETPEFVEREKTPEGLWCHGSSVGKLLKIALAAARGRAAENMRGREFGSYKCREWPHTAGTAMELSGMHTDRIAKVLGNSAAVCERHYIGLRSEDAGPQWPFVW